MVEPTPDSDFSIKMTSGGAVIQLPPKLTVLEAVTFKLTCQKIIQASPPPDHITLDWSKTTFIDSSGIGSLVANVKNTKEKQISLSSRNIHPQVMAVFSMTGLDRVLDIEQSTDLTPPKNPRHAEIQPPATHPSIHSWVKRLIDIVGGIVGIIITGLLLIPIAIAIRLDSPGPIFFGQVRCGWMGQKFTMWKFRSMYIDAEARKSEVPNQASGAFFKNDNDPRVTKVGRFLRKTSLDELPQFWNVIKGEMSLVGTRPPTFYEVDYYEVPEWQRLDIKPGMTGEWQVYGRSKIRNFEDVIELDLRYQKNWSLMYDIKLIIKTVLVLFNKDNGAV